MGVTSSSSARTTGALARAGLAALTLALAFPVGAAQDNDPALRRLCEAREGSNATAALPCGENPQPDQAAFSELAREYGMAFASKLLAPAETLGVNGFEFGFQYAVTNVNQDEDYWQRGIEDETPPTVLQTMALDLRKGLPFSFELGGQVSWLVESELFAVGGSVKWAANEAVEAFPVDLGARVSFSRVVGSTELGLTTVGLDLIISRSFGAAGVANIAPYMAYSPAFVFAQSEVLDSTPGNGADPNRSFVLQDEDIVIHRFVIGSRFILGAANFTPEIVVTKGLQTYNMNVGLDF